MMTSPVCWWCKTVVGKSFNPIMVLEKTTAMPISKVSIPLYPANQANANPRQANNRLLKAVIKSVR